MTRHRCWRLLILWLLSLGIIFFPAPPSLAAGLLDVPLRPWTYFEPYRDWTYTAIEKLVNAGLVGPWVLNTKPISRMEMARVVAMVVRKIQEDEFGQFSQRTDLEPPLYDLMEELAPELRALGIRPGDAESVGQPWLSIQPVSRIQARAFGVRRDVRPENAQGLILTRRFGGIVGFASHLQLGDFASAYLHPEFQVGENEQDGRLVEGYLKLKWNNIALRLGRESIWWGPGYHGSMLFSNNAPPLDQIRIGTAEPVTLPWLLRYLGPLRLELLYARLEANRDFPHAWIGAWRAGIAPLPFLELGFAEAVQFGGQGRAKLNPPDYIRLFWTREPNDRESKFNTNILLSLDATLRLHDIDRVIPVSRDLTLYAEMGVDDSKGSIRQIPIKPSFLVGLYLPNLFRRNDSELRVEWTRTSEIAFDNGLYTTGFSLDGFPLSHYLGTRGEELYVRASERILPSLQIGTEFGLAKVGSTLFAEVNLPREERRYAGVDISYRPTEALSMLLGYRYQRTKNKGLIAGQEETNHIVRLEATYSFAPWEKGQFGRLRRADALRPATPPPGADVKGLPDIDPEEVVSVGYLRRLLHDTGTILTSPLRWDARDWLIFGGVGLATGGLMFADHDIRHYVQKHRRGATDTFSDIFSPFGIYVPAALTAGTYIAGHALDLPRLKATSADALEASLITSGAIVMPMKLLAGRSRPNKNEGSAHYRPFRPDGSLPSFNTAFAFSVASVFAEHFNHPAVSVLAYGLAGAAGLTRITDDKHWASDVLLAAAIGTAVGKAVVKLNEKRREGSRVSVLPLLGQGMQGAALQVEF